MTLLERITADTTEAMKTKQTATLSTLRLLKSAIKNKQIEVQHELSDEEVTVIIKMTVKQTKDSLQTFEEAGRVELADQAKAEIVILKGYLPEEMSDDELGEIVKGVIEQVGATSKEDVGKVMGASMKAVAGRADGSRVKSLVENLLAVFVLVLVGVSSSHYASAASSAFGSPDVTIVFIETVLRIGRVLLLVGGIMFINMILAGGFGYMTSSGRDDLHNSAWGKISGGVIGSIMVACLFAAFTVILGKL